MLHHYLFVRVLETKKRTIPRANVQDCAKTIRNVNVLPLPRNLSKIIENVNRDTSLHPYMNRLWRKLDEDSSCRVQRVKWVSWDRCSLAIIPLNGADFRRIDEQEAVR